MKKSFLPLVAVLFGTMSAIAFLLFGAHSARKAGPENSSTNAGVRSAGSATKRNATAQKPKIGPNQEYKAKVERLTKKYIGTEVETGNVSGKKVALTIDSAFTSGFEQSILDTLKSRGVKCTFFLVGRWAEDNPEIVKRIAADGHELGNHMYSHANPTGLSDAAISEELAKTDAAVVKATGRSTKPFFRAPSGDRNQRVIDMAARDGYLHFFWSVDALDWQEGTTPEQIKRRVLPVIKSNDIVLMHMNYEAEATALPEIIDELKRRGYELVKISDIL
ncbi:MAG: polysaccharide deacetylase family protein, partial [Chloroflexi bacterium]|nr:polysaccharide deacetylase family protein [Chloroflexota bacterium]